MRGFFRPREGIAVGDEFRLRPATNEDGEAVRSVVSSVLREFGFTPDPGATDSA